jgi:hypothetical protein
MLFLCASLPLFWLDPSFRIKTGCPDDVIAGIACADMSNFCLVYNFLLYIRILV